MLSHNQCMGEQRGRCTWGCRWRLCRPLWRWDWRGAWWWCGQPFLLRQRDYPQSEKMEANHQKWKKNKRNGTQYIGSCFYWLTWAPSSCTSLQDSGNTSVAMTGYPCFSRFFAIGFPMFPKPTNPTGVLEARDLDDARTSKKVTLMSIASMRAMYHCRSNVFPFSSKT